MLVGSVVRLLISMKLSFDRLTTLLLTVLMCIAYVTIKKRELRCCNIHCKALAGLNAEKRTGSGCVGDRAYLSATRRASSG